MLSAIVLRMAHVLVDDENCYINGVERWFDGIIHM